MSQFQLADVRKYAESLGVKFDKFTPETLQMGMDVEMEHGRPGPLNVTNGDGLQTAKIALAHLAERPDYYERLEAVEGDAIIIPRARLIAIAITIAIIIIAIYILFYRAGSSQGSGLTKETLYRSVVHPIYQQK